MSRDLTSETIVPPVHAKVKRVLRVHDGMVFGKVGVRGVSLKEIGMQ